MALQRRRRWIWLALPFLALPLLVRAALPRIGDSLARALVVVAPLARSAATSDAASSSPRGDDAMGHDAIGDDAIGDDAIDAPATASAVPTAVRRRSPSTDAGAPDAPSARGSLFIPGSVTARALPMAAKTVRATSVVLGDGTRGVELRGVRALRVGLDEGDVLVALEGHPTPAPDDAMSAVTATLAAHARQIHGTVLRRGRPVDVTVELPPP